MIFSVPDRSGRGYQYYRSRGIFVTPNPHYAHPGQLGMPVTEAAPNLPPDAVRVGEGEQARGVIARAVESPFPWALVAVLGVAAWLILK